MAEDERHSIIGGIEEERRLEAAHNVSVKEAEKALPAFRERLDVLIRTHIVPPKEGIVVVKDLFSAIAFGEGGHEKRYLTTLNAKVNSSRGIVEVHIGATSYPSQEAGDSGQPSQMDYKVDVQDLNHYLLIEGGKGFLESKGRNTSMPEDPMSVVIGHRYPTWPEWRRPVDMDDLGRYNELLDTLETRDVEFSGSTPDIKKLIPRNLPTERTVNAP